MTEEILYKNRSALACLNDALTLMNNNIATILRKTWIYLLVTVVLTSVGISALINLIIGRGASTSVIVSSIAFIAALIAYALLCSKLISIITNLSFKRTIKRILIYEVILLAIALLFSFVEFGIVYATGHSSIIANASPQTIEIIKQILIFMLIIAEILFVMPLVYAGMKYFHDKTIIKNIVKDYRIGMKHFIFIFSTMLLAGFISLIINSLISLPVVILFNAALASHIGVIDGDPSGIPDNYILLAFIATFISSLLVFLVYIWQFLVARYIYGSIETKEK